MIWQLVSLATAVIGFAGGIWGWLKYRQAWKAGYNVRVLEEHAEANERARERQKIEAEIGGLGPDELERRLQGARDT